MESKTLQAFEEAIKGSGQKKLTVNGMEVYFHYPTIAKACYDIHKAECVEFLHWADTSKAAHDFKAQNRTPFQPQMDGSHQEQYKERTRKLFDLYQQSKDK